MSAGRHQDHGGEYRRFGMPTAAGAPDESRPKRWNRGGLAVFYLTVAVTNLIMLHGPARIWTTAIAGATAVLLAVAVLRSRGGRPDWGEWVAIGPVMVSVAQVAFSGQIHHTTTLMLTLVGLGVAVTSRRVAAACGTAACAGWLAVVAALDQLHTPDLGHYAVQVTFSALLGLLLHESLRRRQRQLQQARDEVSAVAERFSSLFRASPAGVAVVDERDNLVAANAAFCTLAGRPEQELIGTAAAVFTDGAGMAAGLERQWVRPDGSVRWVWLTTGNSGSWRLIQVQDVTDRHLAEAAVRESDRLLAAVSATARRIRTGEDARSTIIAAVRELAEADTVTLLEPVAPASVPGGPPPRPVEVVVTGASGADVIGTRIPLGGRSMTARVHESGEPIFLADPAQDPRVSPELLKMVEGKSMLWQPVVANGTVGAILAVGWGRRVESVSDHRARAVALLADETALALEHERLLRRLEQMAFTDTLTGLPNRRAWQTHLAGLFGQARSTGRPLTVAIADLDHFKRYNDTHGHPAGDDLLHRAAVAFARELREGDLIARWGGEEFVIALPGCAAAEAAGVLDRLRAATPEGQTCSIGYAVWDTAESAEQLLERADHALYDAKNSGRDAVHPAPFTPAALAS